MLEAGLADYRDNPSSFADMVELWRTGDLERISGEMETGMAGQEALAEAILYERNAQWAAELDVLMREETGVFFVAVGAGHLGGDKSVIAMLAERGYQAERR